MKRTFQILSLVTCLLVSTRANGEVIYRFSGVVPDNVYYNDSQPDSYWQTRIRPGETWEVALSVVYREDQQSGSRYGEYVDPVLGGSFTFSGGYSGTINAGGTLDVHNDASGRDAVLFNQLSGTGSDGGWLSSISFSAVTDQLSALTSDEMPRPYTSFTSSPDTIPGSTFRVFNFLHGNYYVRYTTAHANNSTFAAVPEPSTIAISFGFCLIGGLIAWRKRNKAWQRGLL